MDRILLNGITIACERRGQGEALLLIHGYPLDHSIWNELVPLLETSFDLILPDLRGFGASTTLDTQYRIGDMAEDLAGLLKALGIQKAIVAGHSMGGYVALALAKNHPTLVGGLALISSQAAPDSPERRAGRYKTAEEVALKGAEIVAEAMAPKLSAERRVQKFVKRLIGMQSREGLVGALMAMAEREDASSFLSSYAQPAVLVHGEADSLIPIERAREIKAANPRIRLVELPGLGHMPMMESPQKTAEALLALK